MASARTQSRQARSGRSLSFRRFLALFCLLAALAFGALAYMTRPRFSMYLWAAAAVCMLAEAALLFKRRRAPVFIYILLAVLCAALVVTSPAYLKYVPLFEKYDYTSVDITSLQLKQDPPENFSLLTNLRSLDLRGSDISDFEPFKSCTKLENLDVRDNYAFTQADRDEFSAALPDCEVLWSMPVAGRYYDSNVREIDISDRDLPTAEIEQIMREHPQIAFTYALNVLGQRVDMNTVDLDLQNANPVDVDELYTNLRLLPNVERVDLRGTPVPIETVRALQDQHPQIEFLFTFDVPQGTLSTPDTAFTFAGGSAAELSAYEPFFEYMPGLQKVDLSTVQFPEEEINRLLAAYPDKDIVFSFNMFGVKVSSMDTKVVLDNIKLGSTEAVESYLKYLPHVQQIDMCNCGISNAEMDALRQRHPEIKFVWTVHFAIWNLRTDIEVFSTLTDCDWSYSSATFAPLQYCTDLLFLDLGHDHVSNIEGVAKLTKLKVLILACNTITDISPLAGLKDLEYLELFSNRITDFSPLAGMTKLVDLNINRNRVQSIEPFLTLTSLKRFWCGACGLKESQLKRIKEAIPGVQINTSSGNRPTSAGWREHSHYFTIKKMYETKKYIPWND